MVCATCKALAISAGQWDKKILYIEKVKWITCMFKLSHTCIQMVKAFIVSIPCENEDEKDFMRYQWRQSHLVWLLIRKSCAEHHLYSWQN